jgi:preprotein translocase subunit YajC
MFITTAYAADATGASSLTDADNLIQFVPIILVAVVCYMLLILPQQARLKKQKALIDALKKGDEIVTGGGIIGKVQNVTSDTEVLVEIAPGTQVRVLRSTITSTTAALAEGAAPQDKIKSKAGRTN